MRKVLIIERDFAVRCLLEVLCEHLGHEPIACGDAGESEAENGFDLALIEPAAPRALAFARLMRRAKPGLPIIFVSSAAATCETNEVGPEAHLVKPASLAALEDAIACALGW